MRRLTELQRIVTAIFGVVILAAVTSSPAGARDAPPAIDRGTLPDWFSEPGDLAEAFGGDLFPQMALPERDRIDGVEHRRPDSGHPTEPAAIRMILDFHGVPYDEGLADRITVRERYANEFIPPRDLIHALKGISVETQFFASWDPYDEDHDENWEIALRMIKAAIHLDLPVLVGYRPEMEIETPEYAGVAVGYDRRNIHLLEPFGSQQPVPYDLRDFKFMFAYAMILFPVFDPAVNRPVEEIPIKTALLNEISSIILALPLFDPQLLTERLRERGFEAELQDVNRTDYRDSLGKTRRFAREGGIPLLDALLDSGKIAIIPQEYRRNYVGFALIYRRTDDDFAVVHFSPDRTFARQLTSRHDLARRWLNRDDRTYHLDLVHLPIE